MANFFQKYTILTLAVLFLTVTVFVDAFAKNVEGQGCLNAVFDCEPGYRCINNICRWPRVPA